jgi:hypothetical protein
MLKKAKFSETLTPVRRKQTNGAPIFISSVDSTCQSELFGKVRSKQFFFGGERHRKHFSVQCKVEGVRSSKPCKSKSAR